MPYSNINEISLSDIQLKDSFWSPRQALNAKTTIFQQYDQLENTKCIDNFRILARNKETFREGLYFSDSDAFKWLDAACLSYINDKDPEMRNLILEFGDLVEECQASDGYLYTYNQILFPGVRWKNLQMEHELYCFGHLLEAAVSWQFAFEDEPKIAQKMLNVALRAADLIFNAFNGKGPKCTPGHQEIELSLFKLYLITGKTKYKELATQFLNERGKVKHYFSLLLGNSFSTAARLARTRRKKRKFYKSHQENKQEDFSLPPNVKAKTNFKTWVRFVHTVISGKETQQHSPLKDQKTPEGHAVRFAYQQTAAAMLCQLENRTQIQKSIEKSWNRMVKRRAFVTGGLGQYPVIEGFGRDYELDPFVAYCETCAALGSMFWNWEMTKLTGNAKYSDFFEWQLYNASLVCLSLEGNQYFYRNPLASKKPYQRQDWYLVPCCPSNLSRMWASLGKYIYSITDEGHENNQKEDSSSSILWLHQYIGNQTPLSIAGVSIIAKMDSAFPWEGKATLELHSSSKIEVEKKMLLKFRIPSWSVGTDNSLGEKENEIVVKINGEICPISLQSKDFVKTASGVDPFSAQYGEIALKMEKQVPMRIEFFFPMPVVVRKMDERSKPRMASLSRGPIVYCVESVDNSDVDIFDLQLKKGVEFDVISAEKTFSSEKLLEGAKLIEGKTQNGVKFTAIPYFCWANRGPSQFTTKFSI